MSIDTSSKIVILPKDCQQLQIFKLKYGDNPRVFLFCRDMLLEMREFGGNDSSDTIEPRLRNHGAVKSIIVENREASKCGGVFQNPGIFLATKFNFMYLLLMYFSESRTIRTLRPLEDIIEDIETAFKCSFQDSQQMIAKSIAIACDRVSENGDDFFKFSQPKCHEWLKSKIDALCSLIRNKPDYFISSKFSNELLRNIESAPEEIKNLLILKSAINFVFESYLTGAMKTSYMDWAGVDFEPLQKFKQDLKAKEKVLEAVESNLANVVQMTSATKKKNATPAKRKPKTGAKVEVGKGKLDSFFARK